MKHILTGLLACGLGLLLALAASVVDFEEHEARIHQHLQAVEKEPCSHGDHPMCTHLPLLEIQTGGQTIPGEYVINAQDQSVGTTKTEEGESRIRVSLEITDNAHTNNHPEDAPAVSSQALFNIRGQSSRLFDKKGYRITLIQEDGSNNNQPVMGMDPHHEWVLHGPFLDKSLIRNYMWYNISGEIMEYAPNVRFCEVVIDGEYQGLYVMTEKITAGYEGSRLTLNVKKKGSSYGGYVVRLSDFFDFQDTISTIYDFGYYTYVTRTPVEVVYPGRSNQTPEMVRAIELEFSAMEKTLYSYDYDSKEHGYTQWLDLDSFVDYYIINEFTCNIDAGRKSTYYYKDVSGKYKLCVWDFNNSCDNYIESPVQRDDFSLFNRLLCHMLWRDEGFTEAFIARYRQLRQGVLSEEYLLGYIDDVTAYLGPAIDRNFEKWGSSFHRDADLLRGEGRAIGSYDQAIDQLKDFLVERGDWLDKNIESVQEFSAESAVKKYNEHAD